MKQMLTGILSCALAVSLALPAFGDAGAGSVVDTGRKGSLTLIKIRENSAAVIENHGKALSSVSGKGMKGIRFGALKIADITAAASSDGTGTFFTELDSSFISLAGECGVTISGRTINGKEHYTLEEVSQALYAINSVTGTAPGEVRVNRLVRDDKRTKHMAATDASGKTVLSGLDLGLYLIAEEDSSGYRGEDAAGLSAVEQIHNPASPFLVSLPITDQGNSDASSEWLYDITVYPKNQTVRIPKYIVSEKDGDTLRQTEDAEIGESVRQVIASDAPAVTQIREQAKNRNYETYVITDRMQDGLSFVRIESVRLGQAVPAPSKLSDFGKFQVLKRGQDYEVYKGEEGSVRLDDSNAAGTGIFRVAMLDGGLSKLNSMNYAGQVAVIFDSVLTRSASDGEEKGNTNRPELTVKNANTELFRISGNEPAVYTYRLKLTKKGVTDPSKVLFGVRRGGEAAAFIKEKSGVYHFYDQDLDRTEKIKTVTDLAPAADGTLMIRGLDADSYEFTEKMTQTGFELLKSSFTVSLTGNDPADGKLAKAVISTSDGSAALPVKGGMVAFEVENMKSLILRTGGRGRGTLYGAGILAAAGAVFVYAFSKKRRRGEI